MISHLPSLPAESVFERDESVTPLESALIILEKWREGISPHEDSSFEKVCTSVKEMVSFIKFIYLLFIKLFI